MVEAMTSPKEPTSDELIAWTRQAMDEVQSGRHFMWAPRAFDNVRLLAQRLEEAREAMQYVYEFHPAYHFGNECVWCLRLRLELAK